MSDFSFTKTYRSFKWIERLGSDRRYLELFGVIKNAYNYIIHEKKLFKNNYSLKELLFY